MQARTGHVVLASVAIAAAAIFAQTLVPRAMMARSSDSFHLQEIIPVSFGDWTLVPNVRLVEPEPDSLERQLYSQELGLGYADRDGHLVMLLVAYGPNQSQRLQLHRPEICYTAAGFRVSRPFGAEIPYRNDAAPLKMTRMTTQREMRLEPVSYWMRVGDDVATGVVERQLIRLKYIFRGLIPDGALFRVSTIGLPTDKAFEVQDQFIRDLLNAIAPDNLEFFVGGRQNSAIANLGGNAAAEPKRETQ